MADKHTDGPWLSIEHSWSRIGIYSGEKCIAALDIYDRATEENEGELGKEMAANARLIAAAPDLLKALKILTANIETAFPAMANLGPVASARKAIEKATGE